MATKKRRVKRRKTKRRQRGGDKPAQEGEKFKLTVDKMQIWDTLKDVTNPSKKSSTLTPEVAKSSKDDIVEFTGEEYSPNYVMKTSEGKFIKAKEAELEKVAAAASTGVGAATDAVPEASLPKPPTTSLAPPPPPNKPEKSSTAATSTASTASTDHAAKIEELEKKLKENWNCECTQKTSTTGGKKSRKRKNKKRARKNTRTKKRRM